MESASRWENSTKKFTDPEIGRVQSAHLINDVIQNYGWKNINVQVKDRTSGGRSSILSDANGIVHAGEMIAIMGPSGSGKTTLLNAIAHRVPAAKAIITGDRLANGERTNLQKLRDLSSYVEQDDALIGSLTVRETIEFAAGLSLPR